MRSPWRSSKRDKSCSRPPVIVDRWNRLQHELVQESSASFQAAALLAGTGVALLNLNSFIDGAVALSKIVRFTVLVCASIMALEQVGIDTSIVTSSVQIIMATIGLGLALAFGLGGRDTAAEIIRNFVSSRGRGGTAPSQ